MLQGHYTALLHLHPHHSHIKQRRYTMKQSAECIQTLWQQHCQSYTGVQILFSPKRLFMCTCINRLICLKVLSGDEFPLQKNCPAGIHGYLIFTFKGRISMAMVSESRPEYSNIPVESLKAFNSIQHTAETRYLSWVHAELCSEESADTAPQSGNWNFVEQDWKHCVTLEEPGVPAEACSRSTSPTDPATSYIWNSKQNLTWRHYNTFLIYS